MMAAPIGFFDSGIGGLTIWKEVVHLLPFQHTIYVSDNAYAPYGTKTHLQLLERCRTNTEFLLEKGCKLIVVACNTATTNVIATLRNEYPINFVGVEPSIKPAALATKTSVIGVLATQGTLKSSLFLKTAANHLKNITLIKQHGKGLVDLIERGNISGNTTLYLLQNYLSPMRAKNIDYLVLGCTHYPFLKPLITEILGTGVTVIDSGIPVAKRVQSLLKNDFQKQPQQPKHHFFSTGDDKILRVMVEKMTVDFFDSRIYI